MFHRRCSRTSAPGVGHDQCWPLSRLLSKPNSPLCVHGSICQLLRLSSATIVFRTQQFIIRCFHFLPEVWNSVCRYIERTIVPDTLRLFMFDQHTNHPPCRSVLARSDCIVYEDQSITTSSVESFIMDAENCFLLVMEATRSEGKILCRTHAHDIFPESFGPDTTNFRIF